MRKCIYIRKYTKPRYRERRETYLYLRRLERWREKRPTMEERKEANNGGKLQ
jgi:hypothetical protein